MATASTVTSVRRLEVLERACMGLSLGRGWEPGACDEIVRMPRKVWTRFTGAYRGTARLHGSRRDG